MRGQYTHPATGTSNEYKRKGWTVIATGLSKQEAEKHRFPEGSVWLTTGEMFADPAKQQEKAA